MVLDYAEKELLVPKFLRMSDKVQGLERVYGLKAVGYSALLVGFRV